ncbi:MAG: sigma-70 family RNA polymerase sigma factor [Planctomycetota bacterium]|jgi:RNA polymerase sigma factor (TIGR02999 family)
MGNESQEAAREQPVTALLQAAARGEPHAADELLPLVYAELRRLAGARMANAPRGQTLEPTALVHEAYMRLVGRTDREWDGRGHFFFAAARAMRDILVEHARSKATLKRGGNRRRVDLANLVCASEAPPEDLLALSDALVELERSDGRAHQVVVLRFFGGMTLDQVAKLLEVSPRTVKNDWRYARAWLKGRLVEQPDDGSPA